LNLEPGTLNLELETSRGRLRLVVNAVRK